MKHLIALGFAVLCAAPVAAQAQAWQYPDGTGQNGDCYAMTMRGDKAFAVQGAPKDKSNVGAIVILARAGLIPDGTDPVNLTFSAKGKWAGNHPAQEETSQGATTLLVPLDAFNDLDLLGDSFHVMARKGSTVVFEADVTGFRAAVDATRKCVAAR